MCALFTAVRIKRVSSAKEGGREGGLMEHKNPARAFCSCGIFNPSWRNRDGDERTLMPQRSSWEQIESSCCGCAVSLRLSFLLSPPPLTPYSFSPFYFFFSTSFIVSQAITSSSSVGITQTVTFESGVEMMVSLPRALLASASILMPRNSKLLQASKRVPT